jgi:hypothetical protein
LQHFQDDRAARYKGEPPMILPSVSDDPTAPCAMPGADSYRFFTETQNFAPNWRNEVTLRSAELARENEPGVHIARISPTPLLMIVADNDLLTPTDICLEAYQRALPGPFCPLHRTVRNNQRSRMQMVRHSLAARAARQTTSDTFVSLNCAWSVRPCPQSADGGPAHRFISNSLLLMRV